MVVKGKLHNVHFLENGKSTKIWASGVFNVFSVLLTVRVYDQSL